MLTGTSHASDGKPRRGASDAAIDLARLDCSTANGTDFDSSFERDAVAQRFRHQTDDGNPGNELLSNPRYGKRGIGRSRRFIMGAVRLAERRGQIHLALRERQLDQYHRNGEPH